MLIRLFSGHFSQVIWANSKEMGVGVASNRSGQIFVVACYDPAGNFLGQFKENVPPVGYEVNCVIILMFLFIHRRTRTRIQLPLNVLFRNFWF